MGEVVMFRSRTALQPAVPLTFGAISAKLRVITSELEHTLATITGAEAVAHDAFRRLNEQWDALRRTKTFCARGSAATELQDLDDTVSAIFIKSYRYRPKAPVHLAAAPSKAQSAASDPRHQ